MSDIQRIVELYNLHGSKRRVARELKISRNTVSQYLQRVQDVKDGVEETILPKDRQIQRPCTALTPEIREQIHSILEKNADLPKKQRWNGQKIWNHLVTEGYTISYSTVKREIASWKRQYGHRDVYIAQETDPGCRAEFDFGKTDLQIRARWGKYPMASMVLNNSLYRFSYLYHRETFLEIIDAHIRFFNEIDGVPETIFYDNMAAIINPRTKEWNPRFLDFSLHYGFEPHACNARSPHEKGTDEQTVGYVRRRAFSERTAFSSLEEANQYLAATVNEINDGFVYRRSLPPSQGLLHEQETFAPLPALEFSTYQSRSARISKYSHVVFESNYYSVPDTYPGNYVTLNYSPDTVELVGGNALLARHKRRFGKGELAYDLTHFLKTFSRKPGALPHSRVFRQLDEAIQHLLHQHYAGRHKDFLPILSLFRETSEKELVAAIRLLEDHGMVPTYETLRCVIMHQAIQLPDTPLPLDRIIMEEPNFSHYDDYLRGVL